MAKFKSQKTSGRRQTSHSVETGSLFGFLGSSIRSVTGANPKTLYAWVGAGLLGVVGWQVYKVFIKPKLPTSISGAADDSLPFDSTALVPGMTLTYAEVVKQLFNFMYGEGLFSFQFSWYNTDEAALIKFLNSIPSSCFVAVNKFYVAFKEEKAGAWKMMGNINRTLFEDVKNTLNAGELAKLTTMQSYL